MTTPIKIGIRELVRDTSILDKYDIIKIVDKKSHKLKGIFISSEYAKEVEKFLEEKKKKEVQEKLDALNSIVEFARNGHNAFLDQFENDDPKILQKVKAMME
jgi:hypothetical protein